ncbi:uncharacterized protein EMH_0097160 [Eimeria mitis]|uniref:FH2 domain-containing protein n=1 Tax=Eimeria mitis TaxID=44415 RepID=U6KBU4_9EIME|nr:uncharacterized protein EMH_0097160 [Eimeria mitis]CDJ35394.1 hypothetical protein EMH_0097160 [Eimeria mitis]
MLPLARLAAASSRLRVVRFDLLAPKTIKELDEALDLVDTAAEQGRSSRKFRVLLQAVLQWGNYVNHGVRLAVAAEETQAAGEATAAAAAANAAASAASVEWAVLQWGNYVNHGVRLAVAAEETHAAGEATAAAAAANAAASAASVECLPTRGFALTSLLKLMEFRSTVDSRLSSLHYILVNLVRTCCCCYRCCYCS